MDILTSPTLDDIRHAAHLFDDPLDDASTTAFLADERHHLLIARLDGEPAGFVTAIELLHPDKAKPEMFLYELGVDARHRRRGVATALLTKLLDVCRERGCGEMFVLSDASNAAAMAAYEKVGGVRRANSALFEWWFR